MAFLGVFVFVGVGGESLGLETNVDQYYEETNLADGWIYSYYLNDLFLEQVNLLGATTQMERQVVLDSTADFENKPDVTLHFVENNTISKFYLVEGKPLDINDSNGVWLDKSFADAKGLKVGDNITFEFEGYKIQKQIRGLGYSPEYVYHESEYGTLPDYNKIGFAYLSYKAFPTDNVTYNVLNVKFDGTAQNYDKLLDYRLGGYYISFMERSEHSSVSQMSNQITLHKMMADIFPVVFILISMLILLTTMTRMVSHQRTKIGILKANGFKNYVIILHYASYGSLLVLTGSVLGLILGPMTLPDLIYKTMRHIFTLPSWESVWGTNFIYVVVIMLILSLGVSLFSTKIISNEKPAESIKPKPPKLTTNGFLERFRFWHNVSFNTRWNYRNAKRNKFRSVMTIIGVIGCTALLVCAFGLSDSMDDLTKWEYNQIEHFDSILTIDEDANQSAVDAVAEEVNGDMIMQTFIELKSPSAKKSGGIIVLDGTDLITPTDGNHNKFKLNDDEISISQKMADLLGVTVGDEIKWHLLNSDKWVKTKIDKIHASPKDQGLFISKKKLEELGLNYTPTFIITADHVDKNFSAIKSASTRENRLQDWNGLTEAAWFLIYILMAFASILSVVVIYNLELLSFTEIERDIATLKILGFKTNDLRKLLLTQNMWFTCIGFVLGIPIGFYILKTMWASAGDSFYVVPFLSVSNIVFTAIITFALSIFVNWMFSGKIKKLDMVESIKGGD